MPTDSGQAKCSFEAIGRTMTEKYPVLATSDAKVAWCFFNSKLSSALRNMRCRIKGKISDPASVVHSKKRQMLHVVKKCHC